jgi:hypothetical protein
MLAHAVGFVTLSDRLRLFVVITGAADDADDAPGQAAAALAKLARRDLPPPCDRAPELELCREAVAEVNGGAYGVLRCNYDIGGNKSLNYSFWSKTVPAAIVELARSAPRAAVKALGDMAVEDCPPTLILLSRRRLGRPSPAHHLRGGAPGAKFAARDIIILH